MKQNNIEWEEVEMNYEEIPAYPKKLKLLSDQNISLDIVEAFHIFRPKVSIKTVYEYGLDGHPDENIVAKARKLKRVLVTSDMDFWDERKHPINKCFGIICIDAGPQEFGKTLKGFALFWAFFAQFFSNDDWYALKSLVKTNGFNLRFIRGGQLQETEYLIDKGKVMQRKIR